MLVSGRVHPSDLFFVLGPIKKNDGIVSYGFVFFGGAKKNTESMWWFQRFLYFPAGFSGEMIQFDLSIFFEWVETTNL